MREPRARLVAPVMAPRSSGLHLDSKRLEKTPHTSPLQILASRPEPVDRALLFQRIISQPLVEETPGDSGDEMAAVGEAVAGDEGDSAALPSEPGIPLSRQEMVQLVREQNMQMKLKPWGSEPQSSGRHVVSKHLEAGQNLEATTTTPQVLSLDHLLDDTTTLALPEPETEPPRKPPVTTTQCNMCYAVCPEPYFCEQCRAGPHCGPCQDAHALDCTRDDLRPISRRPTDRSAAGRPTDVRWTALRAHFTASDRVLTRRERSHIECATVSILRSQQADFLPCRLLASVVSERIRPSRVADDPYTEREIVRACAAAKDGDRVYRFQLSRDTFGRIEISLEGSSQVSDPSAEILQGQRDSARTEGERGGESQQQVQRCIGDARPARHRDRRREPPRRRLPSPPPRDWVADRYRLRTGANVLSLRPRKRKKDSEESQGSDSSKATT
jgi:hypothetical protein